MKKNRKIDKENDKIWCVSSTYFKYVSACRDKCKRKCQAYKNYVCPTLFT